MPVPPAWQRPIEEWEYALRASGRSINTIATRTDQLRRLARASLADDPWSVTKPALLAWVGRQSWNNEGRRSVYAGIRAFYRWAVDMDYLAASPADCLPAVKPGQPKPRPTPESVYRAALLGADDRSQLILRLAGECGLRRAEIAHVHARDLLEDLVGWSLVAHGKGGKDRDIPLPPYLAAMIRLRAADGWLFPGDYQGHLSPRWVGKLAVLALPGDWTLHTLRHRFASVSYAVDHDLMTLRDLLGHESVATTQRYVKTVDEAKRRMITAVSQYRRTG